MTMTIKVNQHGEREWQSEENRHIDAQIETVTRVPCLTNVCKVWRSLEEKQRLALASRFNSSWMFSLHELCRGVHYLYWAQYGANH